MAGKGCDDGGGSSGAGLAIFLAAPIPAGFFIRSSSFEPLPFRGCSVAAAERQKCSEVGGSWADTPTACCHPPNKFVKPVAFAASPLRRLRLKRAVKSFVKGVRT